MPGDEEKGEAEGEAGAVDSGVLIMNELGDGPL